MWLHKIFPSQIAEWVFFHIEHLSKKRLQIMSFLIQKMNWAYLEICHDSLTSVLIIAFFYRKIILN